MIYHNEIERFPAQWLRNLAGAGHIDGPAHVDERSIVDVQPDDLTDYTQCHFFAGIGGWSHALRLAGWPASRPVWTGSCPCQPFSVAGKGRGENDERHLWPAFARLIGECKPPVIFGEQVASADGRDWLAGVFADIERMGYAAAGADLCAAGVGAPHIRQRLYWGAVRLDDTDGTRGWLADADEPRPQGWRERRDGARQWFAGPGGVAIWHECLDGKARRIPAEPAFFPLADGVSGRVGQLRAYGNAIVPQVAAQFVTAFMEAVQ